jgi:hypothetical protein
MILVTLLPIFPANSCGFAKSNGVKELSLLSEGNFWRLERLLLGYLQSLERVCIASRGMSTEPGKGSRQN